MAAIKKNTSLKGSAFQHLCANYLTGEHFEDRAVGAAVNDHEHKEVEDDHDGGPGGLSTTGKSHTAGSARD